MQVCPQPFTSTPTPSAEHPPCIVGGTAQDLGASTSHVLWDRHRESTVAPLCTSMWTHIQGCIWLAVAGPEYPPALLTLQVLLSGPQLRLLFTGNGVITPLPSKLLPTPPNLSLHQLPLKSLPQPLPGIQCPPHPESGSPGAPPASPGAGSPESLGRAIGRTTRLAGRLAPLPKGAPIRPALTKQQELAAVPVELPQVDAELVHRGPVPVLVQQRCKLLDLL